MFAVVLTVCVLCHGVFGYPQQPAVYWQPRSLATPRMYFGDFDVENLNPFNWVGNSRWSASSKNDSDDSKLEALYSIVECLTKNDAKDCAQLVDKSKLQFEASKKKKPGKLQPSASTTVATTSTTNTETSTPIPEVQP